MGKTSKPLTIWLTDPDMMEWVYETKDKAGVVTKHYPFQELAAKRHTILTLDPTVPLTGTPDLVMGSRAHFLAPGMEKLVELAVKHARGLKYPPKVKETKCEVKTTPSGSS